MNGQHLCRHEGGYASFCVDITEALAEENELVIRCTDDLHYEAFPYGKQVMNRARVVHPCVRYLADGVAGKRAGHLISRI